MRELDDFLPRRVRQRSAVDVHPAELVDATVTGRRTTEQSRRALDHRSGRRRHVAVVRIVCENNSIYLLLKSYYTERSINYSSPDQKVMYFNEIGVKGPLEAIRAFL